MRHLFDIGWNKSSWPETASAGPRNRCPPSLSAKWNRATTFFLKLGLEIDQQVATGDQIEPRKRRVLQEVLQRKRDNLAQLPLDPIAVIFAVEEPLQARRAHILGD